MLLDNLKINRDNLKINQPFKHEIIHFCRHPASLKVRISEVKDFGNFEISPMLMIFKINSKSKFQNFW